MKVAIGYQVHNSENIALSLRQHLDNGYNFIVAPLVHPRVKKFVPYSDVFLGGSERSKLVVYIPKRDYNLKNNCSLIESEFNYANHIGVNTMLIDCPDNRVALKNLSDIINRQFVSSSEHFNEHQAPSVCIKVPLIPYKSYSSKWRDDEPDVDYDESWEKWNFIRMITQSHPKLFVALELNGDPIDPERIERWFGEPIVMALLSTSSFLTNSSKYPVLSKAYQQLIQKLNFKLAGNFSFVINGNNLHGHLKHYLQYINHLKSTDLFEDKISKFCLGYEDVLQIPLQPLKDNLDSLVYEVFETDDIKYQQYELAIYKAMKKIDKTDIVAMVVGAGRGPLVEKALKAAEQSKKYVTIYAVEKNINAIVTLDVLRDLRWGGNAGLSNGVVQIINEDMRYWVAPRKADLVISELLGSFGDNELSPECLDGIWNYVTKETINIPRSYSSYMCPVQSHKLYSQLLIDKKINNNPYDYGYVVHVRNAYLIDDPQKVFTFVHDDLTKPPNERDNSRAKTMTFRSKLKTVCHGFVGYFDCCLYDDIYLSIVPSTQNANMFSWFPIYFPFQVPFNVDPNDEIVIHLTRNVGNNSVWYEWTVQQPTPSKIHNLKGKHYSISLH